MHDDDIEALAEYRAALESGHDKDAVIAALGETAASWAVREERLLAELSDEADRGAFDRIEEYQSAYKEAFRTWSARLAQERPAAQETASLEVSEVNLDTTSELARPLDGPVVPFVSTERPSPYASTAPRPDMLERERQDTLGRTAEVARESAAAPALPFAPIAKPNGDSGVLAVVTEPRAPRRQEEATGEDDNLDGTREVERKTLSMPALPFVGATGAGSAPTSSAGARALQWTGTEDVDVAKLRGLALPFGSAPPLALEPTMSIERYAELRAELTVNGELHAPTWAKFGIHSSREKEELQHRFAARFRADPAAQKEFVELVRLAVSRVGADSGRASKHESIDLLPRDAIGPRHLDAEKRGDKGGPGQS